jgi:uncharacterized OsmC-like protein
MYVTARNTGGKRFEMVARGHKVSVDQPIENEGTDSAMTPPELFISAIAACAAYYADEYLKVRGLPNEGVEIQISAEKGDRPARITEIHIDVVAPGLNQRHRDGILRAVDACLLKHTLHKLPQITTRVSAAPVEEPDHVLA